MKDDKKLIIDEGCGPDGIVVCLRMGDDPGPERMRRLNHALERVALESAGWNTIDRDFACALHGLSFHASGIVNGWKFRGKAWRNALVDDELPAAYIAIGHIFGD